MIKTRYQFYFNFLILIFLIFAFFNSCAFAARSIIHIYNDEGVSTESLAQTLHAIKEATQNHYQIKTINAKDVIQGDWIKQSVLFVMPGGADIPYAIKLNGTGNAMIKNFVKNGGSYLGFCAGAYYAAGYVEFDKGGELEVLGKRELAFFPGKVIGPFLAPYHYDNNEGAQAALIHTEDKKIKGKLTSYYNGGGFFQDSSRYSNVTVLAHYAQENKPLMPAIVSIHYGKGRVVLSGVHVEYDPFLLDEHDPYVSSTLPSLKKDQAKRLALFNYILSVLIG